MHVNIDDSSFPNYSNFEWNRKTDAKVIDILTKAQVNSIVFDMIFFNSGNAENDEILTSSTAKSNRVYFPLILRTKTYKPSNYPIYPPYTGKEFINHNLWNMHVKNDSTILQALSFITPYHDLCTTSKGLGHITATPDHDGVYRRFPLLIKYEKGYFPSLAFRMVCDYLHVRPSKIETILGKHIILNNAHFPDGLVTDIKIPIDKEARMIINFAGPWADSFPQYSYGKFIYISNDDILTEMLRDEIENDLVFVGNVVTGRGDVGTTPLESFSPLVGLHSNIANTILTQNFINMLPEWQQILFDLLLMCAIIGVAIYFKNIRFSIFTILIFLPFIGIFCLLFFNQNTLTNLVRSYIGVQLAFIVINIYRYITEEHEKRVTRIKFEDYFSPSVLKKVLQSRECINGSEKKELTIMFSNISGITLWCATQSPKEIKDTLNEYFEEMANIAFKYEGTIDKNISNGLMVFFGAPIERADHQTQAVLAAIDMQLKALELRRKWKIEGKLNLQIRIGINSGEVVVGNMRSHKQINYSILGANVNLAQRLENDAPLDGILISQSVYDKVKHNVMTNHKGTITTHDIKEKLNVFEIVYTGKLTIPFL